MKVAEMQAGPELDALVAEKVMNWKKSTKVRVLGRYWEDSDGDAVGGFCDDNGIDEDSGEKVPRWSPSQDISDAWQVVEKLSQRMLYIKVAVENCSGIRVDCVMYDDASGGDHTKGLWVSACRETVPLAICEAALKAAAKL